MYVKVLLNSYYNRLSTRYMYAHLMYMLLIKNLVTIHIRMATGIHRISTHKNLPNLQNSFMDIYGFFAPLNCDD